MKVRLEDLKSRANEDSKRDGPAAEMEKTGTDSTSVLDHLSAELKRLKEENRILSTENTALQKQLERAKEESSADIMELTEKWQKAQSKAHMLESTISFDAEVNTQVAKLWATHGADAETSENWIIVSDNPIDNDTSPGLSALDVFDFVHEQKIAIQEERAMYLELLAEHDDLLALLAQQDLERASLHAALARVAGQEAVDDAMAVAEKNALHEFGKYVKLARKARFCGCRLQSLLEPIPRLLFLVLARYYPLCSQLSLYDSPHILPLRVLYLYTVASHHPPISIHGHG
jgi:hypothetical protein